jgi:hypothetical protein
MSSCVRRGGAQYLEDHPRKAIRQNEVEEASPTKRAGDTGAEDGNSYRARRNVSVRHAELVVVVVSIATSKPVQGDYRALQTFSPVIHHDMHRLVYRARAYSEVNDMAPYRVSDNTNAGCRRWFALRSFPVSSDLLALAVPPRTRQEEGSGLPDPVQRVMHAMPAMAERKCAPMATCWPRSGR